MLRQTCVVALLVGAMSAQAGEVAGERALADATPEIFKKAAAQYRRLDAALTPLVEAAKGKRVGPQSWTKEKGYRLNDPQGWTGGHYPGSLWFLYEATGDAFFRDRAVVWTEMLETNSYSAANHDIGFITMCSYGNARRLLKTDRYDALLKRTAKTLTTRYSDKLGLIRSWGKPNEKKDFLVIPDNLMNLELLEWAAKATKGKDGERFHAIACSHADVTMRNHYRADGGCYHVLNYDQTTKRVQKILRGQGASCTTAWARGQSWSVYGYTMLYRETALTRYLDEAVKLAEFVLSHPNLPEDGVPYWDYGAPGEERDTSAAAILASALIELSRYVDSARANRYRALAVKALASLASPAYFAAEGENGCFLLMHGVGHKPGKSEVDVPLVYGDYYFLEGLLRLKQLRAEEAARAKTAAALPPRATLPGTDRAIWAKLAATPSAKKAIARGAKRLAEPIPVTEDRLYNEFYENGNRSRYQKRQFGRVDMMTDLAVAEALERKGRFLPKLVEVMNAICEQRCWILPAHDRKRNTYFGRRQVVDLFSSAIAADLATVVQTLGDALPAALVARVKAECERRVFGPLRRTYPLVGENGWFRKGVEVGDHWWVVCEMNWNSVCHANVTRAALGLLDDPAERALFADMAVREVPHAANGFTPDGYCSEGMGYWNYGYGHLLSLGLTLRDVTDGKIDIFTLPRLRKAAEYAYGYQLQQGHSPSFADGNGAPSGMNLALVRRVWPDLTCVAAEQADPLARCLLSDIGLLCFGKAAPANPDVKDPILPPFTAFPDGQVWLMRAGTALSVAVKGGHNAELHNHNDIGSYHLMSQGKFLVGDPGGEVYTRRTFSAHRYDSPVLNSYGHPVPVVAGGLQKTGAKYRAKILKAEFADGRGCVEMDLKAAYDCPTLTSLVRRFTFDANAKTFTVADHAVFSAPTTFEDPYVLYDGAAVDAKVDVTKGGAYAMRDEKIENPSRPTVMRKAVAFDAPVSEAEVTFTFRAP